MVVEILGVPEIRTLAAGDDPSPLPPVVLIMFPIITVVFVVVVVVLDVLVIVVVSLLPDPDLWRVLLLLLRPLRGSIQWMLLGGGVGAAGAAHLGGGEAHPHFVEIRGGGKDAFWLQSFEGAEFKSMTGFL